MTLHPQRFEIIKEVIGSRIIFADHNCHHLYHVYQNGTSDLIAVFKLRRDAFRFRDRLLNNGCASHSNQQSERDNALSKNKSVEYLESLRTSKQVGEHE
ncbi:MAG: hypothetical protein M0Q91_05065 [Methanoregula sp.]|jgi:hypothetical protein|nr:hypothetical protein [Methanoregula sp.]